MRCVFNNAEVVNQEQPQLEPLVEKIQKKVEVKQKPVTSIEETVTPTKEAIKKEPKVEKKIEKKVETIKEEPKVEEKIEKKKEEVTENTRTPKKGFHLYTVSANVKTKESKLFIQKVVEAKTEKHANIEYDRAIKNEYGKPKSVTKRTLKKYSNGDEDICTEVVDEPKRVIEDSPETIELNKKIELLSSEYLGIFKVELAKSDSIVAPTTKYIYASDVDDAYDQIRYVLQKDGQDSEDIDFLLSKVRNITRMSANAIKMDKGCLKRIALDSVEAIQKIVDGVKEVEEEMYDQAIKKFQTLIEKGFDVYVAKLLPKKKIYFVEIARSPEEANNLILAEGRLAEALRAGQNITGVNVGKVKDICERIQKHQDVDQLKDADVYIQAIKGLAKKGDIAYNFLFSTQDVDNYVGKLDEATEVCKGIKSPADIEKFLDGKIKEMSDDIKEKVEGDAKLRNILRDAQNRHNLMGDKKFLYSLFK